MKVTKTMTLANVVFLVLGSGGIVRNDYIRKECDVKQSQLVHQERELPYLIWNGQKDAYEPTSKKVSGDGAFSVHLEEHLPPGSKNPMIHRSEDWTIKPEDSSLPAMTLYHNEPQVKSEGEILTERHSSATIALFCGLAGALGSGLSLVLRGISLFVNRKPTLKVYSENAAA